MNKQERLAALYLVEIGQVGEIAENIAQAIKTLDVPAFWRHSEKLIDLVNNLEIEYQIALNDLKKEILYESRRDS